MRDFVAGVVSGSGQEAKEVDGLHWDGVLGMDGRWARSLIP